MFTGKYQNTTDAKFRMIIPSKFREELGYKCVMTVGIDSCLYIYPMAQWEEFMTRLMELPISSEGARMFTRNFNEFAVLCEVDKQGRITIPQKLRDRANIKGDLVTIGLMNKIEVWDKETYEVEVESKRLDPAELAKAMEVYGI